MAIPGRLVSRQELMDSNQSSRATTPGSDIQDLVGSVLNAHFGSQHDIEMAEPNIRIAAEDDDAKPEEEIEFRLFFSGPGKTAKIKLDEPDMSKLPLGFVVPERPRDYYFQDRLREKIKQQVSGSTLSGEEVLQLSKMPWPGCVMPWKITTISEKSKRISKSLEIHARADNDDKHGVKARPGKKIRIARRKVQAMKTERADKERQDAKEKEAALREKKIRRNREKKFKKKNKKKEKVKKFGAIAPPTSIIDGDTTAGG
jgi:hypothetical protein